MMLRRTRRRTLRGRTRAVFLVGVWMPGVGAFVGEVREEVVNVVVWMWGEVVQAQVGAQTLE